MLTILEASCGILLVFRLSKVYSGVDFYGKSFFEEGLGANEMGLFMLTCLFFIFVFIYLKFFGHSCGGRRTFLLFF